jgi:hypothetical protein
VKGTVTAVNSAANTVTVKTKDGTVETFQLSAKCTVETGKGAAKAGTESGKGVATGSEVTVHYTEESGKKVAHFFKCW